MKKYHRWLWLGLALVGGSGVSLAAEPSPAAEEICLNGDGWTFQPVKLPFYGYELDAPDRWLPVQRSHRFIVDALSDLANDWTRRQPVRVPMAWSSATSEPGSREVAGDFAFPYFWQYVHQGVYEREFSVPAAGAGRRIKLRFESVNFRCWVYVNDTLVRGDEAGDFTHENKHPFEIDITDRVQAPSTGNRLRIVVHDFTASFEGKFPDEDHPLTGGTYPLGDRCDYYNKDRGWRNIDNGIIGDVMLRMIPPVNVKEVFIRTSVQAGTIEADVTLRNEGPVERTLRVATHVAEWKSAREVLTFSDAPVVTLPPGGVRTLTLRQAWPQPRLWWPHDPFLYRLRVDLDEGAQRVCSDEERFGFREVRMELSEDADRRGFYLNGIRVRLFGESVEPTWKDGYTEGVGTSGLYLYNPEYWSALLDEAKRLNLTVVRTHRGMWLERMFEIADEKGMMMIASSTINNGNHKGGNGTLANQRRAVRDMVTSLRNHPSVVIWELANECPFREEWADEARRHDPTRPLVATQTVPRNHPSPSLAAASGSYAMGLSGYAPNIYQRHHKNWVKKPMYIYEDNACYDQPTNAERLGAVQKGLTIFRGHRSSGYELINTFYTWQKVYGQPRLPAEKLLKIDWQAGETETRGYRPDFARMPLLDPWTDRARPRIIRPLTDYVDSPDAFWRRTFSPVAVFDRDYDQRLDIEANPYVAPLQAARVLTVHNDDLTDLSIEIHVAWTVATFDGGTVLSTGAFDLPVPLGGIRQRPITLDLGQSDAVRVTYRATKSGRERFSETIFLRVGGAEAPSAAVPTSTATGVIVMHALDAGVTSKGYHRAKVPGQAGPGVLLAEPVGASAYVQFNPVVTAEGDYDVLLHVPPGLNGTQGVEILHDTLNTTVMIDLARSGWVKLTAAPVHMHAGALQNAVRIGRGGTTRRSVVDALKLVPVR